MDEKTHPRQVDAEGDSKPETLFTLLRHAQTEWNLEKRIQSLQDSPLTTWGRELALAWGRFLKAWTWDRLLVSPLGRALATAELVNESLARPISLDQRLAEQDWGRWTGRRLPDLEREETEILRALEKSGWEFRPPEGEDRLAVWARSSAALMEAAERWPGRSILVITHEGVIKCLLNRLAGRDFRPGEGQWIRLNRLHRLRASADGLKLEIANAERLPIEAS